MKGTYLTLYEIPWNPRWRTRLYLLYQ